jgi:hypothetical protein
VLKYLTLTVEPAQLKTEAALLRRHGWPMPAPGEIVLVAMDGNQQTLATKRIATDHMAAAVAMGDGFLKQHMPPARDVLAMLTGARNEARKTGRRVWLVYGGPRCGPCFRLGRWMEDQHKTLEREYVIVKVLGGVDTHDTDVLDGIPRKEQSVPSGMRSPNPTERSWSRVRARSAISDSPIQWRVFAIFARCSIGRFRD